MVYNGTQSCMSYMMVRLCLEVVRHCSSAVGKALHSLVENRGSSSVLLSQTSGKFVHPAFLQFTQLYK